MKVRKLLESTVARPGLASFSQGGNYYDLSQSRNENALEGGNNAIQILWK